MDIKLISVTDFLFIDNNRGAEMHIAPRVILIPQYPPFFFFLIGKGNYIKKRSIHDVYKQPKNKKVWKHKNKHPHPTEVLLFLSYKIICKVAKKTLCLKISYHISHQTPKENCQYAIKLFSV